ncbi:hypothetical protein ABT56_12235 [Photobacterium aquae]|uniref:Uncharacterized protein n=1 Tax=Photobacterium aquae TaxID=1195763 RepID=A0A0J1H0U9_9GAMM|nr:hypothetical protein ABT56_12235 [Photobacterium aquae]
MTKTIHSLTLNHMVFIAFLMIAGWGRIFGMVLFPVQVLVELVLVLCLGYQVFKSPQFERGQRIAWVGCMTSGLAVFLYLV